MHSTLQAISISIGDKTFKGGDLVEYAPKDAGWRLRGTVSNRQPLHDDFLVILPPAGEPQLLISRDEGKSWQPTEDAERKLWRIHCEGAMEIVNQ